MHVVEGGEAGGEFGGEAGGQGGGDGVQGVGCGEDGWGEGVRWCRLGTGFGRGGGAYL